MEEVGLDPSMLGDDSFDLERARPWVIGLARKSRKTGFDLGGCGWTGGRNEGGSRWLRVGSR